MSDVVESSDTVPASLSSLPVPTSEPPCTPTALSSSTSSTSPGHMTMSLASPRFVHPRFPVRVGISWVKGEKLEAMDFSRTWYPSKIVEIDETQKMVLIHFEGWNQRYDEWVPMDSDKLRPVTRHSERKDKGSKKRRIHPHPIYRAGEHVLAKWTDCKKYPAKIIRMMEDGSYEVNFFDGVSCLVQAMNIQPLPEEMKNKSPPYKSPPSLKPKISFKSIKVSLPDSVKKRVEQLSAEKKKHEFQDLEVTRKKAEHQTPPESWKKTAELKTLDSVNKNVDQPTHSDILKKKLEQQTSDLKNKIQQVSEDLKKASEEVKMSSLKRKLTPPKVYIKREPDKGSFSCHIRLSPLKAKRLKELKETKSVSLTLPLSTAEASTSKLENEASSKGLEMTSSEVQTNVTSNLQDEDIINKSLVGNLKESTVNSSILVEETELKTQPVLVDFSINSSPKGLSGHTSRKRSRKRSFFSTKKERLKNSKSSKVKACVTTKSPFFKTARAKSLDSGLLEVISTGPTFSAAPLPTAAVQKFVPSKAFIVEEDHNPFKCHFEGCTKAFRKETLLTSHIKYYHTDAETPTSSTAALSPLVQSPIHAPGSRKRRKKTNSICSTDSDISIGSREKLLISKRQRHDSEISITTASPDLINKDIWGDTKNQRFPQDQDESVVVEYDEDFDKDIVNCICGQRETNGLMIQCDICMCWQHFACMDTNNTGEPPANYVCFICENPPGVRDSCKYLHDLSWEKKGELPSFPFVSEPPSENLKSLAMECHELSSVLHKLKSALHSARRQIKISKEEDEHEFQLWQTDWDNWTKPDEDLTLTPRSVDPDPSPTPSTFLFLSAPSGTLSQVCSAATISTSPPTCSAATSTSATIEVTTGLPSPASTPQSSLLDTRIKRDRISSGEDMSPPPSGCTAIPQTPSTSRGGSFLSFQGKADSLVRDLFPGPGGDAEKLTFKGTGIRTLEETEVSTQKEKSSINTLVNGDKNYPVKVNGDSLCTLSNQTIRELLPDSTITGALSSPGRDSLVTSHVNNVEGEKLLSLTLTNLSSNDLCRSDHTVNNSAELSYKSSTTSAMDNDDLLEGHTVKQLNELFVDVNGVQSHSTVYTDDQDNDTDTAEESVDPYKNCEHNLLVHVSKVQTNVEKHLELIEQQIAELENAEHNNVTVQLNEENILNDIPALKKSLSKLARNLYKAQRLCLHN
ncbi:PHD finger protein 20-like isoform X2 [Biomphalaria glabrata]|uniref:PHD finger protein 20-like isoform X2 n=1 Tax=Biomphalaria glabrata TaxID=6526 RepID=A0A9U8ECT8_BIOGL|nr:PHD finger protein 20-like isoform X2 [Biomphalaria glabrata]